MPATPVQPLRAGPFVARAAWAADHPPAPPLPASAGASASTVSGDDTPLVARAPSAGGAPSAATAAGSGAGVAGEMSAAELSGLAERVYEHLARRLRAELLADRERRGLLADPL